MTNLEQRETPAGLRPEDRKVLAGLWDRPEEEKQLLAEFRETYGKDPLALQQIDSYDWESPYHQQLRAWRRACSEGNLEQLGVIEDWLHAHYPALMTRQK